MKLERTSDVIEALLLLDLQVDFLTKTGRMPIDQDQVPNLLDACRVEVERAREKSSPIVAIVNEFHRSDILFNLFRNQAAIVGTPGAAWDPRAPAERDACFTKTKPSAFSNPALQNWLTTRGVKRVRIVGVYAKACVAATAKAALRLGYEVILVGDAIGCANADSRRRALDRLTRAGARTISAVS